MLKCALLAFVLGSFAVCGRADAKPKHRKIYRMPATVVMADRDCARLKRALDLVMSGQIALCSYRNVEGGVTKSIYVRRVSESGECLEVKVPSGCLTGWAQGQ